MPRPEPSPMPDARQRASADASAASAHRRSLREALLASVGAAIILFVSAYGIWFAAQRTAEEQVSAEMARIASTMSSLIDPVLHERLRDPSQMDGADYRRALEPLRRAHRATPGVKFVYTMVRDGDKIRFVLDTSEPGDHDHDGQEDRSAIWDVYDRPDPEMLLALGSPGHPGVATASRVPSTDAWGTFLSGYAPILDATGRQIGIVGVDVDAKKIVADERARQRATLLGIIPAALLVLVVGVGVYRLRRKQLEALEHALDAENAAARQERRTRAIIEGTDVVVWEFDLLEDRYTYLSSTQMNSGYTASDWERPGFWREAAHPDDRAALVDFLTGGRSSAESNRLECRVRMKNGRYMWIEMVVSTDRRDLPPTKLAGVALNVTETHRLRDAAESASKSKSEFLANMSHEIRTPLTAILGYAELLREDGDSSSAPPARLATIDTIRSAGEYLMAVINDILDLSKIEAGRMTVETVAVDLPKLLVETENLLKSRATVKGLDLSVVLATPIPSRAITDPTRLRQVIFNLVGNAIKFTERGRVTVRVSVDSPDEVVQTLRIDVEDTGRGLTAAQAARLFQAFTQADTSVTRTHGGTGLGLTISRRLADLMGGDVTLHATSPGVGSTFRLEIAVITTAESVPVTSLRPAEAVEAARIEKAVVRLAGRVLIAEDNPVNQRLIEVLLGKAGASVRVADNGAIALARIDAAREAGEPFDLLITDIQMPEMDGYTLVRTLRARGEVLPVIALTANALAEDRQLCLDAGCDEYASKPVNLPQLLATCARWIDAARPVAPAAPEAPATPESETGAGPMADLKAGLTADLTV